MYASENYVGTRRGRSTAGDMGYEMFPEKYESTDIWEDPEQLRDDRRDTLKDFGPDNGRMFAHEETRRRTYARDRLNLQDGGARTTTDPWSNEDFDTSFHDKDARGWNTEQPWAEYRRNVEAVLRRTDFKDDGDYSTTGGAIHPNSLYKQIRGAQDWVKARLKIFDTSLTTRHTGGVGVYDNVSNVFKSDYEDQSIMLDGSMNQTFEDPINRSRATMRLSNMIGGGSKDLRSNSTTDHKVLVASYGKLFSNRGLINHETQLRLIADDPRLSKLDSIATGVPKPVVKLIAEKVRRSTQAAAESAAATETYKGAKYDETEQKNRGLRLTQEIVTLLGITENELKLLESKSMGNNRSAQQAFADLYHMVETVHAAPAHIKLQMRDELLLKSAGQGLIVGHNRTSQSQVVVNPKLVEFMEQQVRKSEQPGSADENTRMAIADLSKARQLQVLVYKGAPGSEDITKLARAGLHKVRTDSVKTANYKTLAQTAVQTAQNRNNATETQLWSASGTFVYGQTQKHENNDILTAAMSAEIDNQFGENKALSRHVGRFGDKHAGRYQLRETQDTTNSEIERHTHRKNPKKKS
jgi:hypothetical protein